jgi:hypothetical protein
MKMEKTRATTGIAHLVIAAMLFLTFLISQPVTTTGAPLGITPTATQFVPPTNTPVPPDTPVPTDTPIPANTPLPTDTPVASPTAPSKPKPKQESPSPTPTPVPLLPISGEDRSPNLAMWMLSGAILLDGLVYVLTWRRRRRAKRL